MNPLYIYIYIIGAIITALIIIRKISFPRDSAMDKGFTTIVGGIGGFLWPIVVSGYILYTVATFRLDENK